MYAPYRLQHAMQGVITQPTGGFANVPARPLTNSRIPTIRPVGNGGTNGREPSAEERGSSGPGANRRRHFGVALLFLREPVS
jgi:hypothetical protein